MSLISVEHEKEVETASESRQRLLELARSLDRMGRQTENFLCGQLQQLAASLEEFEREKAAWRRQLRRESADLARQRDELEQLRSDLASKGGGQSILSESGTKRRKSAEHAARKSGEAPLRLLLQPNQATALQLGVLFFELSKLNRDMGGKGVRFEIADVRGPKKGLLSRQVQVDTGSAIYEFTGFPTEPLKARGSHVVLEADNTDRVEQWISFKAQALQTRLAEGDLLKESRGFRSLERSPEIWAFIRDALRRPSSDLCWGDDDQMPSARSLLAGPQVNCILQQVLRLDSCFERLGHDAGLKAQIEV